MDALLPDATATTAKAVRIAVVTALPRPAEDAPENARVDRALAQAGLDGAAAFLHVFARTLPGGRVERFFASPARASAEKLAVNPRLPALFGGHCIQPHDEDVRRLWEELRRLAPRAIVALGPVSCWAIVWRGDAGLLAGRTHLAKACAAAVFAAPDPAILRRRPVFSRDAAFAKAFRMAAEAAR